MSFYEPQGWQAPVRQASWEQPPPPSRSGTSSTSQRDDSKAFASQFEEVDRAIDNLVKSGKYYPMAPRDATPMMMGGGRRYNDHEHRIHPGNRHSVGEFDPIRPHSGSNLQNFYASQRYQARPNDAEQMMQAKRRMAAQRERELRNYHQEQQYNRSVLAEMSSNKSDRSMSPSTLSEEGRRDLIARQHRALYGSDASGFTPPGAFGEDQSNSRDQGPGALGSSGGARDNSPRGADPFNMGQSSNQNAAGDAGNQVTSAGQPETSHPDSSETTGQPGNKPSGSPAGGESPSRQVTKSTTAPIGSGIGPIGSRPNQQQQPQGANSGLNKRSTTPLPSQHNYGFGSNEQTGNAERAGSSDSNNNNTSNTQQKEQGPTPAMGTWGTGSGVWGSNKMGATSVWG